MDAGLLERLRRLGAGDVDPDLLRQALTHPSHAAEHGGGDYQRLEFLGDSVLGAVVASVLFRVLGDRPEGELTRARSVLVRSGALAQVSDEIGLPEHLLLGNGPAREGVRGRASVREAAFEAVVGAVFLSGGMEAAERFVVAAFGDRIGADHLLAVPDDPKSRLQELAQRRGIGLPEYEIVGRSGPAHRHEFTAEVRVAGDVVGTGSGPSKQVAEKAAALQAVEALEAPVRRGRRAKRGPRL